MKVTGTDDKGVTTLEGAMVIDGTTITVTGKQYENKSGEKNSFYVATDDYYAVMKANDISRKTIDAIKAVEEKMIVAAVELLTADVEERPSFTKRELSFGNTGLEVSLKPHSLVPAGTNFTPGEAQTYKDQWGTPGVSRSIELPKEIRKNSDGFAATQARVEKALVGKAVPEKKAA